MGEKLASNHVVKIGIVCEDVEQTARRYADIFKQEPVPAGEGGDVPPPPPGGYACETGKVYNGRPCGDVPMAVKCIYLSPVYLELIQPLDDTPSPWRDHLRAHGTSVCFVSFYVDGFERQLDLMAAKGYPVIFSEEKGFERYAYFDTLASLGLLLEVKERTPRPGKGE